jgi:3-methyladenine DNA glycosylase AlkD
MVKDELINKLMFYKDEKYKIFNDKLTLSKYSSIGVSIPNIRRIVKDIDENDINTIYEFSPDFIEIIYVKGMLLSKIKDYNLFLVYLYKYLPLIDNWATCDIIVSCIKLKKNDKDLFLKELYKIFNGNNFYKRFVYVTLLRFYMYENYFKDLEYFLSYKSDFYYVSMAKAWLICEMYIKMNNMTYEYLKENINLIEYDTIKRSAQKIRDSFRVSQENKQKITNLLKK